MKHFCTWLLAFAAVITLCAADAPAKKSPAKAKKTVRSAKVPRTSPAVPIAVKGEACGHIAIDLDAPRPVQLAARELQKMVQMITGGDLVAQCQDVKADEILIVRSMIRAEGDMFLDDMTIEEVRNALPAPLRITENSGEGFWRAISGWEECSNG